MRIQFLETVPSGNPEYPFVGGQVVHLARLTPLFRRFIADGKAFVLDGSEDEEELATIEAREKAVIKRGKRR